MYERLLCRVCDVYVYVYVCVMCSVVWCSVRSLVECGVVLYGCCDVVVR